MFADIQALDLFLRGHAQAEGLFNREPDQQGGRHHKRADAENTERLAPQKLEAAAVKQTVGRLNTADAVLREQADRQRAEHTVHQVNG